MVADADLDDAPEALNVAKGRTRDIHLRGEEILDRAALPVRQHGADTRPGVDQAVGADGAQRLAHGVAAGAEEVAKLALGRQRIADGEATAADQVEDLAGGRVDGRGARCTRRRSSRPVRSDC